jgi:hypothetical protein
MTASFRYFLLVILFFGPDINTQYIYIYMLYPMGLGESAMIGLFMSWYISDMVDCRKSSTLVRFPAWWYVSGVPSTSCVISFVSEGNLSSRYILRHTAR